MSSTSLNTRLQHAIDRILWGMSDLRDRLITSAWWPSVTVHAVDSDGKVWAIRGRQVRAESKRVKPRARILGASECLWGQIMLPNLARKQLPPAIKEAMWQHSPISPEQMLCGWTAAPLAGGGWQVNWGLAPRSKQSADASLGQQDEPVPTYLWQGASPYPVDDDAYSPVKRRQHWLDALGLMAIAAVILAMAGLALVPAALQRQAVVSAMVSMRTLEPQATPIRQQLESLRTQTEVLAEVRKGLLSSIPPADLLDTLSIALPDDTVIDRLDVNGLEVRITGLTSNATQLLSNLAQNPAFADAKATNAAVRDNATNKERFTYEMRWRGGVNP